MCRAACVSRPPSQIGCILRLAASISLTSRASSLRRSVRSCTAFPLCVAPAQPHALRPLKVTVSAIQPLIIGRRTAKINDLSEARSVSTGLHDQLIHPGRHHDVHRHTIWSGDQQKVAALCRLQVIDLPLGQIEGLLQLHGLGVLLGTQKKNAGICCKHGAIFGFEKVAGVLADQDQAPAVLSNPASQANKESPDWFVFQQKTDFVNKEVARPTIAAQCSPKPVGQKQAGWRYELLAQVAKVEPHDVCPKVDVGGCAEESSEIAGDPAPKGGTHARARIGAIELSPNISEDWCCKRIGDH